MRKESPGHILETNGLLDEAYTKLIHVMRNPQAAEWESRLHFYKVASRIMRNILVDIARSKKGEEDYNQVSLSRAANLAVTDKDELSWADWVKLDKALKKLEAKNPMWSQIVELICFGKKLTQKQIAEILGCSLSTVKRDTKMVRAFLRVALRGDK